MKKFVSLLILLAMLSMALIGCSSTPSANKTVKLGYVNWAEGIAMTNLVAAVLEDKLGYKVEMTLADAAPIFTSLASGNTDVFLDAWLPLTHEDYLEKYGDDLDDLGYNYENALIGLVVPAYVDIDSIEELNANKAAFGGKIIGIDSGAGIMSATEKAIQEYGLDYELLNGSGPTMTAALKKAIDANEAIVVTGWAPHWKFARWDLKVLQDPKKIYGESENIHTVTRKGFSEDMPDVAAFLKNFKMDQTQLGDLMGLIEDSSEEPLDVAKKWAENHQELINSWLSEN